MKKMHREVFNQVLKTKLKMLARVSLTNVQAVEFACGFYFNPVA
jgi:hypothetical protein